MVRDQGDVAARVIIDFTSSDKAWEAEKALKALGIKSIRMEMQERFCRPCFAGNHGLHSENAACNCPRCNAGKEVR